MIEVYKLGNCCSKDEQSSDDQSEGNGGVINEDFYTTNFCQQYHEETPGVSELSSDKQCKGSKSDLDGNSTDIFFQKYLEDVDEFYKSLGSLLKINDTFDIETNLSLNLKLLETIDNIKTLVFEHDFYPEHQETGWITGKLLYFFLN